MRQNKYSPWMILTDPSSLPEALHGGIVAIGNFDGVHRGHQYMLRAARDVARMSGRPFIVLTFEPHPRRFFNPDGAPFRIAPPPVKLRRLGHEEADAVIVLNFGGALCATPADAFVRDVLVGRLHAHAVVVGQDFRFGKGRTGTVQTITDISAAMDAPIAVHALPPLTDTSGVLSSTRVRDALRSGNLSLANDLLGWWWEVEGVVIHGDKRGRELGYPTANIPLGETLWPSYGIYAVQVKVEGEPASEGRWLNGAANIGIRPMFALKEPLLEAYIFDFDAQIYDRAVRVRPIAKIRDEAKFDSLDALIAQMRDDCAKARTILKEAPAD